MAKRKDAMALFEAISKTKAKPGGQVLPPHVGIQPQPVKAESRAVLYVQPTSGGESAEPGDGPPAGPVPSVSATRGTWVSDAQDRAQSEPLTGSYEPDTGPVVAGRAEVDRPAPAKMPESETTPAVVKLPKPAVTVKPPSSGGVPMVRAAVSAPPASRGGVGFGPSTPRLVAMVLAAALVIGGGVWYVARSGAVQDDSSRNQHQAAADGTQAGLGVHEELPPPPPEIVPGKYYMVVQDTGGGEEKHRQAAIQIAEWLTKRDIPAVAGQGTNGHWGVLACRPFDERPWREDANGKPAYSREAEAFARDIEKLGKEYFDQTRTYKFNQTNSKGVFSPFFVPVRVNN